MYEALLQLHYPPTRYSLSHYITAAMEDFRFPTKNPMLPDYKKKGCIINVELIRITAKIFKHLNIFPEDVEWLENFLSEFKGNTSTYFAPSSEVSLLERYCREYWQINLCFLQHVSK